MNTKYYKKYKRKLVRLENRDASIAETVTYLMRLERHKDKMYDSEYQNLVDRANYYIEYTKRRLNI